MPCPAQPLCQRPLHPTLWAASIVTVTRATSPAPASPSARVSVTRSQCGTTTWVPNWGQGRGTGGLPSQSRHVFIARPQLPFAPSVPPPCRKMRACPCPIITPRKRPSPSSPLHGAKPGGRPSGTRCQGDLSVLVPGSLLPSPLHPSAPGAQSPSASGQGVYPATSLSHWPPTAPRCSSP